MILLKNNSMFIYNFKEKGIRNFKIWLGAGIYDFGLVGQWINLS